MNLSYSVSNGGALCTCGHIRACHKDGTGHCAEYLDPESGCLCDKFVDRAELSQSGIVGTSVAAGGYMLKTMEIIYCVFDSDGYECSDFIGAFSTQELAEEFAEAAQKLANVEYAVRYHPRSREACEACKGTGNHWCEESGEFERHACEVCKGRMSDDLNPQTISVRPFELDVVDLSDYQSGLDLARMFAGENSA